MPLNANGMEKLAKIRNRLIDMEQCHPLAFEKNEFLRLPTVVLMESKWLMKMLMRSLRINPDDLNTVAVPAEDVEFEDDDADLVGSR